VESASLVWSRGFLQINGRLPTALEYAHEGFSGGQCDCAQIGECPLSSHGKMEVTTDRQCYANQLRDFISLANE